MDNKFSELESVIHNLERVSDVRDIIELTKLNAATSILHKWLIRRERVWRQRARFYGFNMKDHNTKFFHASIIFKKKKNEIIQTNINGKAVLGVSNLKYKVRKCLAQRFKQELVPNFDFSLDNHPKITVTQVEFLEKIPSTEEVKQVV